MLSNPFRTELKVATFLNIMSIFNCLPHSWLVFTFVAPDCGQILWLACAPRALHSMAHLFRFCTVTCDRLTSCLFNYASSSTLYPSQSLDGSSVASRLASLKALVNKQSQEQQTTPETEWKRNVCVHWFHIHSLPLPDTFLPPQGWPGINKWFYLGPSQLPPPCICEFSLRCNKILLIKLSWLCSLNVHLVDHQIERLSVEINIGLKETGHWSMHRRAKHWKIFAVPTQYVNSSVFDQGFECPEFT